MIKVSEELDALINELIDLCGMPDGKKQQAYDHFTSMTRSEIAQRIRELRTIQESFLTYKLGVAATMAAELA